MFKKFPSIGNLSNPIEVESFLNSSDSIGYTLTEKLDGANLCIYYHPKNKVVEYYTRQGLNALTHFTDLETCTKEFFDNVLCHIPVEIILYGEFINGKVMSRIPYGEKPTIKIFDSFELRRNSFLGFKFTCDYLTGLGVDTKQWCVPIIDKDINAGSLKEELADKSLIPWKSFYGNFEPEGAVLSSGYPHNLYFKLKSDKFEEVKKHKKPVEIGTEIKTANRMFRDYITYNRACNVKSKIGDKINNSNMSKIIRLLITDAKEEFLKDYPEYANHSELAKILNTGNLPYLIVCTLINEEREKHK